MQSEIQLNNLMNILRRIEEKVESIEREIISMQNTDAELSLSDKQLVDLTITKVKSNNFADLVTLEELSEKAGV